jgi:feruloyl esterase
VTGQSLPRVGEDGKNYYIGFQVRLPLDWNGRFLFQGGGGNDGAVQTATGSVTGFSSALARGFAVASTDGGHQGGGATFRLDTQARIDHAYAAYTRVTDMSKALIAAAYGRPVDRSYFMGCSGGGRQAMVFPQRFPSYFDGIVAGAPAMRAAREASVAAVWSVKSYLTAAPTDAAGNPILSRAMSNADMTLLAGAIAQQCDGLDGAQDGMVSANPAQCHFDPLVLQCAGAKTPDCLTADQVASVRSDFTGPHNSAGEAL